MTQPKRIIVIGASQGGLEALRSIAAGLPAGFPAALFMVLHVGTHPSELPQLLNAVSELPAAHPSTGDTIHAGHIYVAPPDHHLTVEKGYMRLTRGPRENWARPAIDPLFRSAAHAYGPGVIGIVLTGALNDGTAGLFEIKQRGGTTIVQDPADAVNPSMPRSALTHVSIDHCEKLAALPQLLAHLVADGARAISSTNPDLARPLRQDMTADYTHAQPVAITCPDCGGALRRSELGSLAQFRCHIGHVYTAEVMVAAQSLALERSLETALRSLGERGDLCNQMVEQARAAGDLQAKARWEAAARKALRQAVALQKLLEEEADAA